MIRRLKNVATALFQGTYGVTVEVLALAVLFAFAALVASLVSLLL